MMLGNFLFIHTLHIIRAHKIWCRNDADVDDIHAVLELLDRLYKPLMRPIASRRSTSDLGFFVCDFHDGWHDVGMKPVSWRVSPPLPSKMCETTTTSKLASRNCNLLAAVTFSFCRDLAVLTLWLASPSAKQVSPDAIFAGAPSLHVGLFIATGLPTCKTSQSLLPLHENEIWCSQTFAVLWRKVCPRSLPPET